MSASDATTSGEPDSSSGATAQTTDTPTEPTTAAPTSEAPTDTTTLDTDPSTGDSTTAAPCLEFIDKPFDETPEPRFTCSLPLLCGGGEPVLFQSFERPITTDDIDRARCLAAALRDRQIGAIQYQQPSLGPHVTTIEILGGEQAVYRDDHQNDFNWDYTERVGFLRPPEFFTDCAEGSAFAILNCLEDAFTGECADQLACP